MTDDAGRTVDARAAMEHLHRVTSREHSLYTVLQTVAESITQVLPGRVEASVCVLVAGKPSGLFHTGQRALELDEVQCQVGCGPSLHAARTGQAAEVVDARTDARWPRYMTYAVERGSLSSLSIGLGSHDVMDVGLSIYSREPAAFTSEGQRTAKSLTRLAARALAHMHVRQSAEELADNLRRALETRAVIDHSRSILVERHTMTPEQSFRALAYAAMRSKHDLRGVADHVVRTGELPQVARRP